MAAKGQTLFELTDEALGLKEALLAVVEMADQAQDDAMAEQFGAATSYLQEQFDTLLAGDYADKVDGYGWLVRELEEEAEAYKAVVTEFRAKQAARENAIKRLTNALQASMEQLGLNEAKGKLRKLALQNSSLSVPDDQVDLDAALGAGLATATVRVVLSNPDDLRKVEAWLGAGGLACEVTKKADKSAIKAAFKTDPNSIDGIAVVEQGRHLRIR